MFFYVLIIFKIKKEIKLIEINQYNKIVKVLYNNIKIDTLCLIVFIVTLLEMNVLASIITKPYFFTM